MRHWLMVAAACLPAVAQAQAPSGPAPGVSAQGDLAITIYNNDQALVEDVRRLDLPAGRVRQEFPDVSARIRPETVTLDAPGATIVEQNFDYDLLSPTALLDKSVGQQITVVRTNPGNGQETREVATVLAVNNGVVLQVGDRIETLPQDAPERLIFAHVPTNLRARPTLSVTLESNRAGTRPVGLRYLTPGLGWKADYVALFDETAGKLDVQGWVTLTNQTGTTFNAARLLLVAGQVGQGEQPVRWRPPPGAIRTAGTETAAHEQLGDFYLYPLAARSTIADQQTKQVSFLDVAGAPATRGYEYRAGWLETRDEPQSADTILRFSTAGGSGLGDALPAGTVRVYQKDRAGQPQFVGENEIGHTPMGSEVGLKTGEAFDVKVQPVQQSRTRLSADHWRTVMHYTLTNAKPAAVTVDLIQQGVAWGYADTRITDETMQSERRSADQAVWHVPVPANGRVELTATFDTRY